MTAAARRPDPDAHLTVPPRGSVETAATPPAHAEQAAAPPADLLAMARQAHRATVTRLTKELLDAVADDSAAVPEAARLHAWLSADFLPWVLAQETLLDGDAARAAVRSDCGILTGLASLVNGSHGEDAAGWARQIHRTSLILLTRLDYASS